jgi:hypothetical protein
MIILKENNDDTLIYFGEYWAISTIYHHHQASIFMTPGDRVAQLYPQALGTHFSYLLQHVWVTVGLFFNPGHHTGEFVYTKS